MADASAMVSESHRSASAPRGNCARASSKSLCGGSTAARCFWPSLLRTRRARFTDERGPRRPPRQRAARCRSQRPGPCAWPGGRCARAFSRHGPPAGTRRRAASPDARAAEPHLRRVAPRPPGCGGARKHAGVAAARRGGLRAELMALRLRQPASPSMRRQRARTSGACNGKAQGVARKAHRLARGSLRANAGAWRPARGSLRADADAWRLARGSLRAEAGAWRPARGSLRADAGAWRPARASCVPARGAAASRLATRRPETRRRLSGSRPPLPGRRRRFAAHEAQVRSPPRRYRPRVTSMVAWTSSSCTPSAWRK